MAAGVYLLHFSEPLKHARHYLGYADDVSRRVAEHTAGRGARLTEVAHEAGISFELVRVWSGRGRTFERQLKNRHNAPKLCPICNRKLEQDLTCDVIF